MTAAAGPVCAGTCGRRVSARHMPRCPFCRRPLCLACECPGKCSAKFLDGPAPKSDVEVRADAVVEARTMFDATMRDLDARFASSNYASVGRSRAKKKLVDGTTIVIEIRHPGEPAKLRPRPRNKQ